SNGRNAADRSSSCRPQAPERSGCEPAGDSLRHLLPRGARRSAGSIQALQPDDGGSARRLRRAPDALRRAPARGGIRRHQRACRGSRDSHDTLDGGGAAIESVMRSVLPVAVIFGEAPLRGPFRLSHRIATSLRLWQVGVENVFDRNFPAYARAEWPDIDRWLFFGMLDSAVPARLSHGSAVVPPLLRFPAGFGSFERDRISVIAYDRQTLLT